MSIDRFAFGHAQRLQRRANRFVGRLDAYQATAQISKSTQRALRRVGHQCVALGKNLELAGLDRIQAVDKLLQVAERALDRDMAKQGGAL